MVQGITNAVIQQGGAGAGDIVYAVNDTDKELVEGDKVWLNVVTDEGEYKQKILSDIYNAYLVYSLGHNLYVSNLRYVWTGSNFTSLKYSGVYLTETVFPIIRPWGMFFNNNQHIVYPSGRDVWTSKGFVLNNKYSISTDGICTYNPETGEETVVADRPQTTYTTCYMDDDSDAIMFYTSADVTFDIYEDFHNPSEGHRTFKCFGYPMWVTNGLKDNSYFICHQGGGDRERLSNATPIIIYKLHNNTLLTATDLPESLQNMMRKQYIWATYKDDTKVLTILNAPESRVYAYKVVDGVFKEVINAPITLNRIGTDSLAYGYFNDDMTQLVVFYYERGGYTYYTAVAFHYNIVDGKFHASPYVYKNEQTLTGFATGVTNEEGEVEIKTALPTKVTMTFNITPDEDTFEFKGITV